jgi:hypothetical protein
MVNSFPIIGIVPKRLVITVAPQRLICPQTSTYPKKPAAIINKNNARPVNQTKMFLNDLK